MKSKGPRSRLGRFSIVSWTLVEDTYIRQNISGMTMLDEITYAWSMNNNFEDSDHEKIKSENESIGKEERCWQPSEYSWGCAPQLLLEQWQERWERNPGRQSAILPFDEWSREIKIDSQQSDDNLIFMFEYLCICVVQLFCKKEGGITYATTRNKYLVIHISRYVIWCSIFIVVNSITQKSD